MSKRGNVNACPLVRGFVLGLLYSKGHTLTSERIRREMRASKATAKRDMQKIATIVHATPIKIAGIKKHLQRRVAQGAA